MLEDDTLLTGVVNSDSQMKISRSMIITLLASWVFWNMCIDIPTREGECKFLVKEGLLDLQNNALTNLSYTPLNIEFEYTILNCDGRKWMLE